MKSARQTEADNARPLSAPEWIFLAIAAASCLLAFVNLDRNSLWMDELYTAHFTDPALSFSAFLDRVAQDTNPPVYYGSIYALRQISEDPEISVRAFSAVFAAATIAVLIAGFSSILSRRARLFAAAFAAASAAFFYYAQEGRAYALAMFICAVMAAFMFRALRASSTERRTHSLIALTGASILGGLTHFYLIPIAGGMFLVLLIGAENWRRRIGVVAGGLAVLLSAIAFIVWQQSRAVYVDGDLWFNNSAPFLLMSFKEGAKTFAGSIYGLGAVSIIFAGLVFQLRTAAFPRMNFPAMRAVMLTPEGASSLVLTFAVLSTLAISFFMQPIFSPRVFLPLLPLWWILLGLMFERTMKIPHPSFKTVVLTAICGLLVIAGLRGAYRFIPTDVENWRASAQIVAGFETCESAPIPTASRQFGLKDSRAEPLYAHYLPDEFATGLVDFELTAIEREPRWRKIIERKLSDEDPCPLALWAVHSITDKRAATIRAELDKIVGSFQGRRVKVMRWNSNDIPAHGLFFLPGKKEASKTFLFIVE